METEDLFETNVNTVKEMILDEEKVVTYITLSKELCMHVNKSKTLLTNCLLKIRKEHPNIELNITYIISGLSTDNIGVTKLCTEEHLNKLRTSLRFLYFCHVYSISKGALIENNILTNLNKYEDFSLCAGAIKGKQCIKRTTDEIGHLKVKSEEAILPVIKPLGPSIKSKQDPKPKLETNAKCEVENLKPKQIEIKPEIKIKTENLTVNEPVKQVSLKTTNIGTQKGISSFFNKSNGLEKKKIKKEPQVDTIKEQTANTNNKNITLTGVTIKEEVTISENPKVVNNDANVKNNQGTKKVKKSVDKKRKRVLQISDSESDDENDPFRDEKIIKDLDDEIPPTPMTDNSAKITQGIINPKKRRKVIDKTYTDEEGYVLTKKVEVYESCSDNESDVKISVPVMEVQSLTSPKSKQPDIKISKKKISPPQKGKQSTINNFFTKK